MKIIKKYIFILSLLCFGTNVSLASFDLIISNISLSDGGNVVSLFSEPSINITIENVGSDIAQNSTNINEGFIVCKEFISTNDVFRSSPMNTFIVNPGTSMIAGNLKLKSTLTQTQRTVEIICYVNKDGAFNNAFTSNETDFTDTSNSRKFSFGVDKVGRFDSSMDRAIAPIRKNLDAAEPKSLMGGGDSIRSFVFNKLMNVVTPIIIIVGILVGIIGAYKLFFASTSEETSKGIQLIVYGILGIMIILSAKYIGNVIFEEMFAKGNATAINGVDLADKLYHQIAYPFIKIAIYLVLGVLFVVLASKTFSFLGKSDGSAQKKAGTMIARSTIAMLIIIGSKQIVEAVYGKQNDILNTQAQTFGELGSGILADKSIPILYTVINWIMGLTSLVILVIIIFQTFQIITNPEKAENRQKISKSILYIFIGILVIGAGYLLTNFLVIN